MVEGDDVADNEGRNDGSDETADCDGPEALFLGEVVLQVEVDSDKADVTALAVEDRAVSGKEVAVVT